VTIAPATLSGAGKCLVCGAAGAGKVFFSGTYHVGSVAGTYATEEVELRGGNADLVREAVEYFTGKTLRR